MISESSDKKPVTIPKGFLVLVRDEVPRSEALGRRYEIPLHGITLGNEMPVDIHFKEPVDCPWKILIAPTQGEWEIQELIPSSIIRMNHVVLQQGRIRDGDRFQIGRLMFEFCTNEGLMMEFFEYNEEARRVDILTQAYNRATLYWFLEKDLNRYKQLEGDRRLKREFLPPETMSLIFMDIDHFGLFNKKYDQIVGDEVLRNVVHRVKSRVRSTDIVGRLGGEEFLIYLPNTDYSKALELAESIRQKIADVPFEVGINKKVQVTVSMGVVQYQEHLSVDDFIRAANEQMKRAKELGRNRVIGDRT